MALPPRAAVLRCAQVYTAFERAGAFEHQFCTGATLWAFINEVRAAYQVGWWHGPVYDKAYAVGQHTYMDSIRTYGRRIYMTADTGCRLRAPSLVCRPTPSTPFSTRWMCSTPPPASSLSLCAPAPAPALPKRTQMSA